MNRLPSDETLNRCGSEGWQLASVLHAAPRVITYLKRLVRRLKAVPIPKLPKV